MSPRLFAHVASMEARTRFSYRVDFWINAILSFGVEMVVVWFMWAAIFEASGSEVIGGRTFPAMVLYYIVVALVDNEEATLKRFRRRGQSIALEAANPAYETRFFGPDRVRVQGRLVGLLRRY